MIHIKFFIKKFVFKISVSFKKINNVKRITWILQKGIHFFNINRCQTVNSNNYNVYISILCHKEVYYYYNGWMASFPYET